MPFDVRNSAQTYEVTNQIHACLRKHSYSVAQKTCWIRLAAPIIAASTSLINIAARVSLILENLIKGVINILGCPFSRKCSFCVGIKQIVFLAPKHLLILPFDIVRRVIGLVHLSLSIVVCPKRTLQYMWQQSDPKLKKQETNRKARIEQHDRYEKILKAHPDNVEALRVLAQEYSHVDIYKVDPQIPMDYFERAAKLGDADSMFALADNYITGFLVPRDPQRAIYWNQQLLDLGDVRAIAMRADFHFDGYGDDGIRADKKIAAELYHEAASKGHFLSMLTYGLILARGNGMVKNIPEAASWIRRVAKTGDLQAKTYLAAILAKDKSLEIAPNEYRDLVRNGKLDLMRVRRFQNELFPEPQGLV